MYVGTSSNFSRRPQTAGCRCSNNTSAAATPAETPEALLAPAAAAAGPVLAAATAAGGAGPLLAAAAAEATPTLEASEALRPRNGGQLTFRKQRGLSLSRCCCGNLPPPFIDTQQQQQQQQQEPRCTCILGVPAEVGSSPFSTSYEALTAETIPLDGSSFCVHPLLDPQPHTTHSPAAAAAAAEGGRSSSSKELPFKVLAALDINEAACAVYRHNFCPQEEQQQQQKKRQQQKHQQQRYLGVCRSVGIEHLPISYFAELGSSLWGLSPPCQPFARRGLKKDYKDPRCSALQQLLLVLRQLQQQQLPRFFLLENVAGFETSEACELLLQLLLQRYETVFVLLLNPLHFGIPSCRRRCFVLARKAHSRDGPHAQWLTNIAPYTNPPAAAAAGAEGRRPVVMDRIPGLYSSPAFFCCPIWPLEAFLEHELPPRCSSSSGKGLSISSKGDESKPPPAGGSKAATATSSPPAASLSSPATQQQQQKRLSLLELTLEQKQGAWHIVDLVTSRSSRSSCFTRNYGRNCLAQYGSILLLDDQQQQQQQQQQQPQQQQQQKRRRRNVELHDVLPPNVRCRFFSVREQLNLHGFPSWFSMSPLLQQQQQQQQEQHSEQQQHRRMIGNSLNVYLMAMLLDFLLGDDPL
ncbi:hypothetical protein Esti_004724 [Eimeria stiedai]